MIFFIVKHMQDIVDTESETILPRGCLKVQGALLVNYKNVKSGPGPGSKFRGRLG